MTLLFGGIATRNIPTAKETLKNLLDANIFSSYSPLAFDSYGIPSEPFYHEISESIPEREDDSWHTPEQEPDSTVENRINFGNKHELGDEYQQHKTHIKHHQGNLISATTEAEVVFLPLIKDPLLLKIALLTNKPIVGYIYATNLEEAIERLTAILAQEHHESDMEPYASPNRYMEFHGVSKNTPPETTPPISIGNYAHCESIPCGTNSYDMRDRIHVTWIQ